MPIIRLDVCFLKGDYGGQLMAVIGRGDNNQNFPIAYVVVEAETKIHYIGFLTFFCMIGRIQSEVQCIYIRTTKGKALILILMHLLVYM